MKEILDSMRQIFDNIHQDIQVTATKLGKPGVSPLTGRKATQTVAAVAVDAGQSMFNGLLREIGATILRVSSSLPDKQTITVPFWCSPFLPEEHIQKQVEEQLDRLKDSVPFIPPFLEAMGWNSPRDAFRNLALDRPDVVIDVVRDLLEWAALYDAAAYLAYLIKNNPGLSQQPLILRDGALRFAHLGQEASKRLEQAFRTIEIPILGFVKRSPLVRHPLIQYWLENYRQETLDLNTPFVVWISKETFEQAGYRLERYFADDENGIRWGQYILIRLDGTPGSRQFFLVDVPNYLYKNVDLVLSLLSNLIQQSGATAYPWPGYPIPLAEAHRKVRLDNQTARMYESVLRARIGGNSASLLRIITTLMDYPTTQE